MRFGGWVYLTVTKVFCRALAPISVNGDAHSDVNIVVLYFISIRDLRIENLLCI